MFKGILYALTACLIWGLIFIIPGSMPEFNEFEITLMKYLIYGVFSWIVFLKSRLRGLCKYPLKIWMKAVVYSLVINCGYYICLVKALRYSTPAITALIIGFSPIAIAFYGNWREKEVSFKSLILPSILIVVGLGFIYIPELQKSGEPLTLIWGIVFAVLALAGWSWFVVANSRFLKKNPEIDPGQWNDLVGAATLFSVLFLIGISALFFQDLLRFESYITWSNELQRLLIGCSILGILCTWYATYLWNKASLILPVTLTGQLTILETIFGILFFYLVEWKLPQTMEIIGIVLFITATVWGVRQFMKQNSRDESAESSV